VAARSTGGRRRARESRAAPAGAFLSFGPARDPPCRARRPEGGGSGLRRAGVTLPVTLSAPALRRLSRNALRRFHVRTRAGALRFIRAAGFCYAFTAGPGRLPGLFDVLDTRSDTRRWAWAWDWKEALPSAKKVFYGRVLRRKPTFISLDYVPHFFALTGNVGDPDDCRRLYDAGRLSYAARGVYELVAQSGPLTTRQIRQALEPHRRGSSSRLLRALAELQSLFLLARVGEVGDNPGNYAYVWDIFDRWLPDAVGRASRISHREAASAVLAQYVRLTGAPRAEDAACLFEWEPEVLQTAIQDLRRAGRLVPVRGPRGEERLALRAALRRRA
jgi:hypothetical protein